MPTHDPESAMVQWLMAKPYWPLRADVFQQLCGVLERHLTGQKLPAEEVQGITAARRRNQEAERAYEIRKGSAVIPITGVIAKYARMVNGTSQLRGTSVETIQRQLDAALADEEVESIFLHIESPGGNIDGLGDLADSIYQASRIKPVTAFADDLAASAAYWLGSQAGRFYANQTAEVGSIGVYCVFVDSSRYAENAGIRVIPVTSGPHKATGLPGTPLTAAQLAPIQANVDAYYEMFLTTILRGRQDRGLTEEDLRPAADGRIFPAARAKELNLIDGIKTLSQALSAAKPSPRTENPPAGMVSASEKTERTPNMTSEKTAPDPAAVEAAHKAGAEEASARLKNLQAAFPADPAFALTAAADGMDVQAAKAMAYDTLHVAHAAALAAKDAELTAAGEKADKMAALLGSKGVSAADIAAFDPSDPAHKPTQGDGTGGAAAKDTKTAAAFSARVEALIAGGLTPGNAYGKAGNELPEAHAAWVAAGCPL